MAGASEPRHHKSTSKSTTKRKRDGSERDPHTKRHRSRDRGVASAISNGINAVKESAATAVTTAVTTAAMPLSTLIPSKTPQQSLKVGGSMDRKDLVREAEYNGMQGKEIQDEDEQSCWVVSSPMGGRMSDIDPILTDDEQYVCCFALL